MKRVSFPQALTKFHFHVGIKDTGTEVSCQVPCQVKALGHLSSEKILESALIYFSTNNMRIVYWLKYHFSLELSKVARCQLVV